MPPLRGTWRGAVLRTTAWQCSLHVQQKGWGGWLGWRVIPRPLHWVFELVLPLAVFYEVTMHVRGVVSSAIERSNSRCLDCNPPRIITIRVNPPHTSPPTAPHITTSNTNGRFACKSGDYRPDPGRTGSLVCSTVPESAHSCSR
jgi:hypothetical protein